MIDDITEYCCGGYLLTKKVQRPAHLSSLLPVQILSASACLCDFVPDSWTLSWTSDSEDDRFQKSLRWGLSDEIYKKIVQWSDMNLNKVFGWPNVVFDRTRISAELHNVCFDACNATILGLGLHSSMVEKYLDSVSMIPQPEGGASRGLSGVYSMIRRNIRFDEHPKVLGFEPILSCSGVFTCSWLCYNCEERIKEALGVVPNKMGFIDKLSDAKSVVTFLESLDKSKDGQWFPWLIVS